MKYIKLLTIAALCSLFLVGYVGIVSSDESRGYYSGTYGSLKMEEDLPHSFVITLKTFEGDGSNYAWYSLKDSKDRKFLFRGLPSSSSLVTTCTAISNEYDGKKYKCNTIAYVHRMIDLNPDATHRQEHENTIELDYGEIYTLYLEETNFMNRRITGEETEITEVETFFIND